MLKTEVIGRLGADAEVRTLNDNKVINFTMAHAQRGVDANGQKTETTVWLSVSKFLPLSSEAKVADYLKKGVAVYVRGDLSVRDYTDKGGQKRFALNLRATEIELLPSDKASGKAGEVPEQDESLPF